MRKGRVSVAASVLAFFAAAAAARAGELNQPKTLVISAENLTALNLVSVSNGADSTFFGLLGNPGEPSPYDIPRLALDGFVTDRVTVGGAITFGRLSFDPGGSLTAFTISPRAGLLIPMSDKLSIWPRGGFTYYSVDNLGGAGANANGFALDLEGMVVFKLIDHFAVTAGAVVDIGLTGSSSVAGNSVDQRFSDFGLRAGLLGWL